MVVVRHQPNREDNTPVARGEETEAEEIEERKLVALAIALLAIAINITNIFAPWGIIATGRRLRERDQ